MLKDIVGAKPLEGYLLHLRFEDGTEGTLDLASRLSFRGVTAPLKELSYFRQVRVDPNLGTVVWPNGADLDPDVLYASITGQPIVIERLRGDEDFPACAPAGGRSVIGSAGPSRGPARGEFAPGSGPGSLLEETGAKHPQR